MHSHDKLEIKSLDALYNKNQRRHAKAKTKRRNENAIESTTRDGI